MVALGLWDKVNFVATPYIQAATTLHELGHNFSLWHGGAAPTWGHKVGDTIVPTYVPPNCNPFDLSVMNYLFQAHGLFKAGSSAPLVDLSGPVFAGASVNETNVGVRPSPVTPLPAFLVCAHPAGHVCVRGGYPAVDEILHRCADETEQRHRRRCGVRRRRFGGRLSRDGPVWDSISIQRSLSVFCRQRNGHLR